MESNSEATEWIRGMRGKGLHVHAPRCDVTDRQLVEHVIEEYKEILPPIKGCIQASMVLKVSHSQFCPSRV